MNTQDEKYSEFRKLGIVARTLSCFLALCAGLALLTAITAFILEPFQYIGVIVIAVSALMLHVSGSILLTGFAPWYLLFAHGKARLDKL